WNRKLRGPHLRGPAMVVSWTILQAEKTAARLLKPLDFRPLCFHFRARLEAARIDFHAVQSKPADRRPRLPRERAIASGRIREGGRGEIFLVEMGEGLAGFSMQLMAEAMVLYEPDSSYV